MLFHSCKAINCSTILARFQSPQFFPSWVLLRYAGAATPVEVTHPWIMTRCGEQLSFCQHSPFTMRSFWQRKGGQPSSCEHY